MLDAGGGGGIVASTKSFAKMASAGFFSVNETGGQALLDAITKMSDWIDRQAPDLNTLTQAAPLGSSYGAETMKPYLQQVAEDNEGFITNLLAFRESLDEAKRGIEAAMASYEETDTGIGDGFAQV